MTTLNKCSVTSLNSTAIIAIALFFITPLYAANTLSVAETLQQNGAEQISVATQDNPEQLWQSYLDSAGYHEGPNTIEGKTFFIQSSSAVVHGAFDSKWIGARNSAFNKAELLAKASLVEALETTIESNRNLNMFQSGANMAPEERDVLQKHKQLSIAKKGEKLLSAKLDEQLRHHFPDWDGTGVSDEDKQSKLATAGDDALNFMAARARKLISGVTPMFYAEGYNDRGDYIVLVGIIWSQDLALIARTFYDPDFQLPVTEPGASISDVLEKRLADQPSDLAAFAGIRIWRDEQGRYVLVSAASSDRGREDFLTERMNELVARNQIAQFIAETIESNTNSNGGISNRGYDDGTNEVFDTEKFESNVSGRVNALKISGALVVRKWKGKHPISGNPMITTVMAWTPDSAQQINQIANQINEPSSPDTQQAIKATVASPRTLTGPSSLFSDF